MSYNKFKIDIFVFINKSKLIQLNCRKMKFILILLISLSSLFVYSQSKKKPIYYNQQIAKGILKMDKSYFYFKSIKQNESKSFSINIINTSKDTIEPVFKNVPEYISLETHPKKLLPQQKGIVKATYDASKNVTANNETKWGKDYKRIPVYIKGKEKYRNPRTDFITFRTFIDIDFSHLSKKELKQAPIIKFDTINYNFGKVVQGTIVKHNFIFENLGKNDLEILYAKGC